MATCIRPERWVEVAGPVAIAREALPAIIGEGFFNLREWADRSTILQWIDEEVGRFQRSDYRASLGVINAPSAFTGMLRLLCFAYGTGIASGSEIVRGCHEDYELHWIAAAEVPFAQEIRNFRRRHRSILGLLLARLFIRAALSSGQFSPKRLPRGFEAYFEEKARKILDLARHLDSCDEQ